MEAQHLCCVCGKGNQRPVVSLPWQDGSIVSNSRLDCQNSLARTEGSAARASQQKPVGRKNVGSISGEAHFNPLSPHDLGTHHSPLADTASLRTSLFLSSRGLAKARITCGLYGSSCGEELILACLTKATKRATSLTLQLIEYYFLVVPEDARWQDDHSIIGYSGKSLPICTLQFISQSHSRVASYA